ncbi:MAG: DUF167 domain-containing protein [Alphaproteobacteria bacterium]|nr:DUF167 domain-containing protein [Alphaproteobacteria bacterium]
MPQLNLFNDTSIIYPLRETSKGIELFIKATPKAAKNRFGDIIEDSHKRYALKVYVTAPPEDNRANQAIIELIAKQFKLAKSQISLVNGTTSREKTLLIEGESIENIKANFPT